MNKQLQRWLDRPGWQLYLYQWGVLGLMGLGVYSMLLRPQWQQQQLSTQEIIQHQQQVERQQSELALFPSLFSLQQELTALSVAETSRQQSGDSIAHLVGKWIGPFGGQVISWQRQSEPRGNLNRLWEVAERVLSSNNNGQQPYGSTFMDYAIYFVS
nr:hypothetical protein [Yersinia enterocolitica]